jgi:WD40 repeat protein
MGSSADPPSTEKQARIHEILAQCLQATKRAATWNPQTWIDRYPELMPELAEHLRCVGMICEAYERNLPESVDTETHASQFTVRCPHCHSIVTSDLHEGWSSVICDSCGSSFGLLGPEAENAELRSGEYFGRFELVRLLGQGAFGAVWEAIDPQLERTIALKLPRRGELTAAEAELFLREARAVARIRHPNIVGIHEVGRVGNRIYLACDFVSGENLADRLARGPFSLDEAVALLESLASTLHYVHEQGMVHRDLKPANVLLDSQQQAHLTDFGLARRYGNDLTLTCDGYVVGTPAYMSPEQAGGRSREADLRADIYSLGVMLYELVTGELPFQGTPHAVIHQLLYDEPRRLRQLNPRVSRDLETICLKCLEKAPQHRYDSAGALSADLKRLRQGLPIAARPIGAVKRVTRWGRRRPFAAALIVTSLLATIAAFAAAAAYRDLAYREITARQSLEHSRQKRLEDLYVARMASVQAAVEEYDYQRASHLLQSLAPGLGDADLRGFEWYYWRDKLREGLLWELGPFERLEAVEYATQTHWLAFGGHGGKLRLRQLPDGQLHEQELVDEDGRPARIYSLAFSPDGLRLAVGTSGHTVMIVDVATRNVVLELKTEGNWIQDLEFSDDGDLLVAGLHEGGKVELWTDLDPQSHRVIQVSDHQVRSLTISADKSLIATIGSPSYGQYGGELTVIDVKSGTVVAQQKSKQVRGWGVVFSQDAQLLFNSYQSPGVDILAVDELKQVEHLGYPGQSRMLSLAMSRDAPLLVAGGLQGELVAWDIDNRQLFRMWSGHTDQVLAISLDPAQQRMFTCSYDGFVKCWDLRPPKVSHAFGNTPCPNPKIRFSPSDETIYLAGGDEEESRIRAYNVDTRALQWESVVPQRIVQTICVSGVGNLLAAGLNRGELQFLDAKTGAELDRPCCHDTEKSIFASAFSPDDKWLVTGEGRNGAPPFSGNRTEEILLWDTNTRRVVHRWRAHDRRISQVLFNADGSELFTYGWDKKIRWWQIPSGQLLGEFSMGMKLAAGLAFAERGRMLVAVDTDGSIWRWMLADQQPLEIIRSRKGSTWLAESYVGDQTILTPLSILSNEDGAQHGSVCFLDMRTWERKLMLDVSPGIALTLAISPDGESLVIGDVDGNLYRWQVERDASEQW